jgi:phenylalanyl-tRNA synthetase beta chain
MICDAEKPIAIAGVMGGLNSEISESTTSVLIESACFEQAGIRKTSKRLGISSDAAYRFERGTDPNGTEDAADRAALMLAELAGGIVHRAVIDVYPHRIKERLIRVRLSRVKKILGVNISSNEVKDLLRPICVAVRPSSGEVLLCTAPTFRPDLEEEIDIIEEIGRLYGYSKIEDKMVSAIDFSQRISCRREIEDVRSSLEGMGFSEIVTNNLLDVDIISAFSENIVKIMNPISKDLSALRPSTVYTMLQTVYHNANLGIGDIKVYEIGRTYGTVEKGNPMSIVKGYWEHEVLSLCIVGRKRPLAWHSRSELVDIYDLKGTVESLLGKILLDKFQFICYDSHSPLTEETIAIEKNGTYIGFLGKVKAELLRKFSVESDVYISELSVRDLIQNEAEVRSYVPPSKFPSIRRDLAFIVDKDVLMEAVERQIRESAGLLLRDVTLFDVFEGKPLLEGKKSFAFALDLNSSEKTLTEEEASMVIEAVVKEVCSKFGAELRSS